MEQGAQYQPDQQQQVHIVPALFKEKPEQDQGKSHHEQDGEEEIPPLVDHAEGLVPVQEHDQGLKKEVHRLKAHDGRGEDPVVRKGLETHRGGGHGTGHQDDGGNLYTSALQGVLPGGGQVQKQKARDQGQGQQKQGSYFLEVLFHLLRNKRTKNKIPPSMPIIIPMGTSKGKMINLPMMSQPNRKMAPKSMV